MRCDNSCREHRRKHENTVGGSQDEMPTAHGGTAHKHGPRGKTPMENTSEVSHEKASVALS